MSWTPDNKFLIFGDKHGLFRVPARVSAPQPSARIVTTDDSARQPAIWRNPQSGQSQLVFARAVTDSDILRIPIGQSGSKTEAPVAPVPVAASTLADHGPQYLAGWHENRFFVGKNRDGGNLDLRCRWRESPATHFLRQRTRSDMPELVARWQIDSLRCHRAWQPRYLPHSR